MSNCRAHGLEAVLVKHVQGRIDAVLRLEAVEEMLAEAHAELDRADMPAVVHHRHHAAHPQPGNAALEAADGFLVLVGRYHGMAERGQVVAELFRLVHT